MAARTDIRNLAIIAHVDHGKTTLVDALLWQSRRVSRQSGGRRPRPGLDGPRAREGHHDPGQEHRRSTTRGVKLNIVDTPGHADFGGEVERGLTMVDGVLLLVDASEGPLPQTRFVLRKALEARLPVILVVNKVDRPDARDRRGDRRGLRAVPRPRRRRVPDRVSDRLHQCARGRLGLARPRTSRAPTSGRCWSCSLEHIPAPEYEPGHPLQAHVTNLDASPYVGRLAICRVRQGTIRRGETIAWCRADGEIERVACSSSTSPRLWTASKPRRRVRARSSRWRGSRRSRSARRSRTRMTRGRCR